MKKVVFGFSRPIKFKPFAELIMLADGSDISHGYTKFVSVSWDECFIYQNSGHKTNFTTQTAFDKINKRVEEYEFEVDDETWNKIGKICCKREGIPYGIYQVIGKGISWVLFFCSFGSLRVKNPFTDSTDCIEEMSIIIAEGFDKKTKLDMDTITVKPYRDWIASLQEGRRVI